MSLVHLFRQFDSMTWNVVFLFGRKEDKIAADRADNLQELWSYTGRHDKEYTLDLY